MSEDRELESKMIPRLQPEGDTRESLKKQLQQIERVVDEESVSFIERGGIQYLKPTQARERFSDMDRAYHGGTDWLLAPKQKRGAHGQNRTAQNTVSSTWQLTEKQDVSELPLLLRPPFHPLRKPTA